MERSLDIQLLLDALAGRSGIPTAQELQQLIANVELQLFLRNPQVSQELINAAWYLHAVASVNQARERYTLPRQRQAFSVSAHIFDLALLEEGRPVVERLSFGFAAAIGYRRGGRDPNATAIMNRLRSHITTAAPLVGHAETLALEVGVAFLGFEIRTLRGWLKSWRNQMESLAALAEVEDLIGTVLGTAHMVVLGATNLLLYFTQGDSLAYELGRQQLRLAAVGQAGPGDLNARWVAAHLLEFSAEAQRGSPWNPEVLPQDVSRLVRQAFTVGSPPVMTLWEPQRELLTGTQSPFSPDVRRLVLAVPTSGGKTLLAQMLAIEHLSRTERSVCYIAPTRSLGREIRRAMASRVRILQKETGADLPDFPSLATLIEQDEFGTADVEVMTPERLANLLRHNARDVLRRFDMFIIDEAQLIKESGRGFVLESTIALLNYLSRASSHRIVLISAAMGNSGSIAQWLSPDGQTLQHESSWRGPRRLHAAFTTDAEWSMTEVQRRPRATSWPYRFSTPLTGRIRLRMASGSTSELTMTPEEGWTLVRKSQDPIPRRWVKYPKDDSLSTKQYRIASEMIVELGHAGSVLVVTETRADAQRVASGIADIVPPSTNSEPLLAFVESQLGENHPLVTVLSKGVGFHHAGLPLEILEAVEEGVRDGTLAYLVCTSTLTDGVNLPVRTVVIYDQSYEGRSDEMRLSGARLVNAIGRAGRAGRETEGWIVLVRGAAPSESDFEDLNPDAERLAVMSTLVSDEALENFAEAEELLCSNEDALFSIDDGKVSAFISYVWLVLSVEEDERSEPATVDLERIVDSTLAAVQSVRSQRACLSIATAVQRTYLRSDSSARRRWPRTGTSLGSARTIDRIASRVADRVLSDEEQGVSLSYLADPTDIVRMLPIVLEELLRLPEAPRWLFRKSTRGEVIEISKVDLLLDWLDGVSLPVMAESHLAGCSPAAWRIEQMVDAVTGHFEHFLSWTLGALVELVNIHLSRAESAAVLCPELGQYIRYGVRQPAALQLMLSGIRSRRLARVIADSLPLEVGVDRESIRKFVSSMTLAKWRTRYDATPSDVSDLTEFVRPKYRSLLYSLLQRGSAFVQMVRSEEELPNSESEVNVTPLRGAPSPAPLIVSVAGVEVGVVASQDHADLSAIIDTCLEVEYGLTSSASRTELTVSLVGTF